MNSRSLGGGGHGWRMVAEGAERFFFILKKGKHASSREVKHSKRKEKGAKDRAAVTITRRHRKPAQLAGNYPSH